MDALLSAIEPTDVVRSKATQIAPVPQRSVHEVTRVLSALRFDDLTTQNPSEVWLAIDHDARKPNGPALPLQVVRFSGHALRRGGNPPGRRGAGARLQSRQAGDDCFKYRHKVRARRRPPSVARLLAAAPMYDG